MRTKPVMVMMIRARILATVKTSWILVAALTLTRFTKVNIPSNRKVIKVNIPSNRKVNIPIHRKVYIHVPVFSKSNSTHIRYFFH